MPPARSTLEIIRSKTASIDIAGLRQLKRQMNVELCVLSPSATWRHRKAGAVLRYRDTVNQAKFSRKSFRHGCRKLHYLSWRRINLRVIPVTRLERSGCRKSAVIFARGY